MIESERASERAGGPARKQEYVVVKKKKLLTYLNIWDYIRVNKGARNESKRSKTNHRVTNPNQQDAGPELQPAGVGV